MNDNPRKSRNFTLIVNKVKAHHYFIAIGIMMTVVISVANFTDSIGRISRLYQDFLNTQSPHEVADLKVFASSISELSVEFSISNPSNTRAFEIASMNIKPLSVINTCALCAYQSRIPLNLSLSDRDSTPVGDATTLGSPYRPKEAAIFGKEGAYKLNPGETAPFILNVLGQSDMGLVFVLIASINNIQSGNKEQLILPLIFYYVGPPDFSPSLEVYRFDKWLSSTNDLLRSNIARGLAELGSPWASEILAEVAQRDPAPYVRATAMESLGSHRTTLSFHVLQSALSFRSESGRFTESQAAMVRKSAAVALGTYGDAAAAPILLKAWNNDEDASVVSAAIESFGLLSGPNAMETLNQILSTNESGEGKTVHNIKNIITAFANTRRFGAIDVLMRYAQSGERYYRRAALEGMRYYKTEIVVNFLKKFAIGSGYNPDDPFNFSRLYAIESLLFMGADTIIEELKAIDDSDLLHDIEMAEALQEYNLNNDPNVLTDILK